MRIIIIVRIIFLYACIFLTTGCGDSTTDPEPDNTALALDYPKGGETLSIGDTVTISFRANGDSINSARIQVTTDKGQNYFHISNQALPITESGTKAYTQQWVIGREDEYDTKLLYKDTVFNDGEDPAWKSNIKIYANENEQISVTSTDFIVNFKTPYYLRYPIGGEVYNFTDTIPVIFTFRTDSMSVIQYFFWSIESGVWSQILTDKRFPEKYEYTLGTFTRLFIPADPDLIEPVGDSTKILIRQYPSGKPVQSGWITIIR
jgi:hypothetical protein